MRSIADTASLLRDTNLIMLVEQMSQMVIDPKGSKDIRDVYALSIRTTL